MNNGSVTRKSSVPWFFRFSRTNSKDHRKRSLDTAKPDNHLSARCDYTGSSFGELSVKRGQTVELLDCESTPQGMCLVLLPGSSYRGLVPSSVLTPAEHSIRDLTPSTSQTLPYKSKSHSMKWLPMSFRRPRAKLKSSLSSSNHLMMTSESRDESPSQSEPSVSADLPDSLTAAEKECRTAGSTSQTVSSSEAVGHHLSVATTCDTNAPCTRPETLNAEERLPTVTLSGSHSPPECSSARAEDRQSDQTERCRYGQTSDQVSHSDTAPAAESAAAAPDSTAAAAAAAAPDSTAAAAAESTKSNGGLHTDTVDSAAGNQTVEPLDEPVPQQCPSQSSVDKPLLDSAADTAQQPVDGSVCGAAATSSSPESPALDGNVFVNGAGGKTDNAGPTGDASGDHNCSGEAESVRDKALLKRRYVVQEMVETEREYIKALSQVVDGYMTMMKDPECALSLPEDLSSGKDRIIFGNIQAIYEWHRDVFSKALEQCVGKPSDLGALFSRYERKFHMYVVFCQNKPRSEHVVLEHIDTYFEGLRKLLGFKPQLTDLLIQPIQRIMRYQLLLTEVLRLTEKAKCTSEAAHIKAAVRVMTVVPKAANDMMNVGRLQGFDGKITAQGKLLMHGTLSCSESTSSNSTRAKDYVVFLFEQIVIFSEALPRRSAFVNPGYVYKSHIQVNKMSLVSDGDDKEDGLGFCLRSTDPNRTALWTCRASSQEERQQWTQQISTMLNTQHDFLLALQSPIAFQKDLVKDT